MFESLVLEIAERYKRRVEIEQGSDFRLFLQRELLRRCKANPKYSLRAFARLLGAEPSFVSKLLNKKRSITPTQVRRFAKQLGLSPLDAERFIEGRPREGSFRNLSLDLFEMIADWQHYAILELVSIDGFKPSFSWIASRLGISVPEARAAVERLERLEFLEITRDGEWRNRSGANTTVGNEFTAAAFRELQKQILEMAITALEEVPLEKRSQSSMTMAIDSSRLKEGKKRIDAFRRELTAYLQGGQKLDGVYQLSISLFPVTKGNP